MASRWSGTLINEEPNALLDLDDWVGQRTSTYRFELVDVVTGYRRQINPISDLPPILTHDTSRTIKRQINNLLLGVEDTQAFNTITSRLEIFMELAGVSYPLGQYMPNGQLRVHSTAGTQSAQGFYDLGFIVDQELPEGFSSLYDGEPLYKTVQRLLSPLPITFALESSVFIDTVSWPAGARRGYIVEQLALDGDWFPPWFDHNNVMRWIRTFDSATAIPTFDFDTGNKVFRAKVTTSDNLIDAPNRFVVISNGISSIGTNSSPVVGVYNVPDAAPHSAANRGFIFTKTESRQLYNVEQANAVARSVGQQQTLFETLNISTAPDPRHDSYDVIRWQGSNWLEISWSLPLIEGGEMTHVARRAYGG